MPRSWLVKQMTASLSQFCWIQTTSCENIFLDKAYKLYNLRPRAHEFKLPLKDDRNYVPRLLFKDMY